MFSFINRFDKVIWSSHNKEIHRTLALRQSGQFALERGASVRNVSTRMSLRSPNYLINRLLIKTTILLIVPWLFNFS